MVQLSRHKKLRINFHSRVSEFLSKMNNVIVFQSGGGSQEAKKYYFVSEEYGRPAVS